MTQSSSPLLPSQAHAAAQADLHETPDRAGLGVGVSRVRQAAEQIARGSATRQRVGSATVREQYGLYVHNLGLKVAGLMADVLHFQDAQKPLAKAFSRHAVRPLLPLSQLWHARFFQQLPSISDLSNAMRPHLTGVDPYTQMQTLQTIVGGVQTGLQHLSTQERAQQASLLEGKALRLNALIRMAMNVQPAVGPLGQEVLNRLPVRLLAPLSEVAHLCQQANRNINHLFDSQLINQSRADKLQIINRLMQGFDVDAAEFRALTALHSSDIEILKHLLAYDPEFPFPEGSVPTTKGFWMEYAHQIENPLLNHLPVQLFSQLDLISLVLEKNPLAFEQFPQVLRLNLVVMNQAITAWGNNLQHLPEELRNTPQWVLIAVQQTGAALQYASEDCRRNPIIVHAAAQQNSRALEYSAPELLADDGFMQTVIPLNPNCFAYASAALKSNPEMIRQALAYEGLNFKYLAEADRRNPEYIQMSIGRNGAAIEFVPHDVPRYIDYVKASFAHTRHSDRAQMLARINLDLLNQRDLVLAAARVSGECIDIPRDDFLDAGGTEAQFEAFRHLIANDREIMEAAIRTHGFSLVLANQAMQEDPVLFAMALLETPDVLEIASDRILNSPQFALAVIQRHAQHCDDVVEYFSPAIRSDLALMGLAVSLNPNNYAHVSNSIRANLNFSIQAMQANPHVYWQLSALHQQHPLILQLHETANNH